MKKILVCGLFGILTIGCWSQKTGIEKAKSNIKFNKILVEELSNMAKIDQIAAFMREDKYNFTPEQWQLFQDSVFTSHQKQSEKIFIKYGFVGYDLAGKEGSDNFWLIVQHSDVKPKFQKLVLEKMKIQVDNGNANPGNYGLLVDRVNLNTGKAQIYGTQVSYRTKICQAYPRKLTDSINVNERRKSIGLEPLEDYLNMMTRMHFQMNKESFLSQGIKQPTLYKSE